MAQTPLFVKDLDTLKAGLRLSGVSQTDPGVMILGAMSKARIKFTDRLPVPRIQQILAIAEVDNPLTPDEILRTRASQCEVMICRLLLMRAMPVLFMDSSGAARQDWNENPLARESTTRLKDELIALEADIEEYLSALEGNTPDETGLAVITMGRKCRNSYPDDQLYRRMGQTGNVERTEFSHGI